MSSDKGVTVMLPRVRINYIQNLFSPEVGKLSDDGKPKKPAWSALFLVPKTSDAARIGREAVKQVAKNGWGAQADTVLKALVAENRVGWRDGDTRLDESGAVHEGFAGHYYFNASSPVKPTIVSNVKDPATGAAKVLAESDGVIYSGCYVNVMIRWWPQGEAGRSSKFGKRINAQLKGVQYAGPGESFGGGAPVPPDAFEAFDSLNEFAGEEAADDLI